MNAEQQPIRSLVVGHVYELTEDRFREVQKFGRGRKRAPELIAAQGTRFVCKEDADGLTLCPISDWRPAWGIRGDDLDMVVPALVEVEHDLASVLKFTGQEPEDVLGQLLADGRVTLEQLRSTAERLQAHEAAKRADVRRSAQARALCDLFGDDADPEVILAGIARLRAEKSASAQPADRD